MQRASIERALTTLLVVNLVVGSVWFGATNWWYMFPRPFLADSRQEALGVSMAIQESNGFRSTSDAFPGNMPKSIGICGIPLSREIYYFRALAPLWDFRAHVLDWRLRGQAVPWLDHYDWEDWTSWLGSLEDNLTGYFVSRLGTERSPTLFFGHDCDSVVAKSPELVVRVVGVSPVVTAGFWPKGGGEGQTFFLALEFTARRQRRQRVYAVGVQPVGPVVSVTGALRPWVAEIPDRFWRDEFDRWPRAGWRPY